MTRLLIVLVLVGMLIGGCISIPPIRTFHDWGGYVENQMQPMELRLRDVSNSL